MRVNEHERTFDSFDPSFFVEERSVEYEKTAGSFRALSIFPRGGTLTELGGRVSTGAGGDRLVRSVRSIVRKPKKRGKESVEKASKIFHCKE